MDINDIESYEKQWASTPSNAINGIYTHTALILKQSFINAGVEPIIPNEVCDSTVSLENPAPDYWNRRVDFRGHLTASWNWGYGVPRDQNGAAVQPLTAPNPA